MITLNTAAARRLATAKRQCGLIAEELCVLLPDASDGVVVTEIIDCIGEVLAGVLGHVAGGASGAESRSVTLSVACLTASFGSVAMIGS
ncbi:hypothetical protein CVS28_19035 [Arthrobacter glacialis]|nr:hypothetical protein CVS28_19035 [Arthrobacter glacialis]